MKRYDTLIKLHKRTLDGLRRKMGALENQKSQLQLLSARLYQELDKEITMANQNPEMSQFFGDFAKRIQTRQEEIALEIRLLDEQMDKLRDEIAEVFAEVKKFEIAKANALKREAEEERRKETIVLDEVAAQQYRRKHEDQ